MITLDTIDLVKAAIECASVGGGFAFARPFATRYFNSWLTRAERRAEIEDAKESAIVRIAVGHERIVGVLETMDKRVERVDVRLDRVDKRLDAIEAHLEIQPRTSGIPSPVPPAAPRRRLTDPDLAPVVERT